MADRVGGTGMFAAPDAIFSREDLRATDKLVYLYLCRRAGPDGTSWPSVRRIAKECSLTVQTVRTCVKRLVTAGLLAKQERVTESGGSTSHLFTIRTDDGGKNETSGGKSVTPGGKSATGGRGKTSTPGGQKENHEGCTLKDAQYEGTPPNPPPGGDTSQGEPEESPYPPEFEEFWDAYPLKLGKTEALGIWKRCLKDARPKVTVDELVKAAKNYAETCALNNKERRYIKRATTFLHPEKRRWEDYVDGVPEAERPIRGPTREPLATSAPPQHYL